MRVVETQADQEQNGPISHDHPQPVAPRTARPQAERNPHFSPDPLRGTDRYRLVTPYRLGEDD